VTRVPRVAALLVLALCAGTAAADEFGPDFTPATPEEAGLDSGQLAELTEWIIDNPLPVYSLLISRNGKLVYELYTSQIDRDRAHYMMSITKSVLSSLVGIAIDARLLPGADAPINAVLPRALFRSDGDWARFGAVTLKQVLGMAALDAIDPPRSFALEAVRRQQEFIGAPNRVRFALTQALLPPGSYQYNDIGPSIAAGAVEYAAKTSALEFAAMRLFEPLGFRNYEWMHQDGQGLDNGGYGLRLRPLDMQKLGILYLNHGRWNGKQFISPGWIERTFTPWNRSHADGPLDYGWFWWTGVPAPGWTMHVASGWKGQRIAVIPAHGLVVTMTGCIEDGREEQHFAHIIDAFVRPATHAGPLPAAPDKLARLRQWLDEARTVRRVASWVEPRMVPSAAPKERRRPTTFK
jgi:CubicO group peptidase (beta-lactamase class C family)